MNNISSPDLSPIFVLGNPRSGTTLLRLMLTAHSDIGIAPECEFIVKQFPRYGHLTKFTKSDVDAFLSDIGGKILDIAEMWEVPLAEIVPNTEALIGLSYAEVCAVIYRGYQSAKGFASGMYWGDKNNAFGNYIDVLTFLYPNARFVHIVRDGRAVLHSYKKLQVDATQKYAPNLPQDSFSVGFDWDDMVNRIDRHLNRYAKGRYVVVRYEDILDRPDHEMRKICDFLGLNYEPSMLEYHIASKKHSHEPKSYHWKKNTRAPIQVKRKDAWTKKLLPKDVETFEAIAKPVMERHQYDLINNNVRRMQNARLMGLRLKARTREVLRHIRKQAVSWRLKVHL